MDGTLGIYIHIPFCRSKCRYCDFCSFSNRAEDIHEYCTQLCVEMKKCVFGARDRQIDTVYFGGGTPSVLPIDEVERLVATLHECFNVTRNAEITFECNPATADKEYFCKLRGLGVNRLSMGLQSALDGELELLGRAHTVKDFEKCFSDARSAGFDNISVDLMYGIPDQTKESFVRSIDYLISLSPEHISAYGLTVEKGTYFEQHKEELKLADDDEQAVMYHILCKRLARAGYQKYEISNFSRSGFESKHNMRYWKCGEYLGFGVAAHSFFGGERFGKSRDIDAFLRGEDIVTEREKLRDIDRLVEFVMLGLRLSSGIDTEEYTRVFGRNFYEDFDVQGFIEAGFMQKEGTHVSFTENGFLLSNTLLSNILP